MTDEPSRSAGYGRPSLTGCGPTIWLVKGEFTVTDARLPAVLHQLADHAALDAASVAAAPIGGVILHAGLTLAWSIARPADEQLVKLVDRPDPQVNYRLLTITITADSSAGWPPPGAMSSRA